MAPSADSTTLETLPSTGRVHVVGAGPVGLLLTALLQSMEGFSVHLYEKRHDYTRSRMVRLSPYLVADSVETYRTDAIDGDSVEALFDPSELAEGLAFRESIPSDLMALLRGWALGFCPLNSIERDVSDLIDGRRSNTVERAETVVTAEDAMAMLEPGDILIDCTGSQLAASRSPGTHLQPSRWSHEHAEDTARVRARHHLPLRPDLRLQRALQVLQKPRQRALQVHSHGPSHTPRRHGQPRLRHRQHHGRGL